MFNRTRKKPSYADALSGKRIPNRSGINGVLASLWRSILLQQGVTWQVWGIYIDKFVAKAFKNQDNRRDRTSIRGNLNKEFFRNRMTWKVFCKGMALLDFLAFRVVIIGLRRDGTITEHGTVVDYSTVETALPEEEFVKFLRFRVDHSQGWEKPTPDPATPDNAVYHVRMSDLDSNDEKEQDNDKQLELF